MPFLRLLICSFLILLPSLGIAQGDTIYYDNDGRKTTYPYADYYRVWWKEGPNNFKIEDHYLTRNRLKMTCHFTDMESETKEGPYAEYNKMGIKVKQGNYKGGKEDGIWENYYALAGTIWYSENYKNGVLDGEVVCYYSDGKVKRREQHRAGDTSVTGKCFDEQGKEIPFTPTTIMPRAPFNIQEYLSRTMRYPGKAMRKNIEGRLRVRFTVDVEGNISNVVLLNSIGGGCDEEAIRVVKAMPKWIPGKLDGHTIPVYFTLPIVFKLQ